jgi:hypothetical protein
MSLGVLSTLASFVDDDLSSGDLTDQTISALRSKFLEYDHAPSEAMWVGISSLVDALESMAKDTLAPLPYLSPLDPGVGKTEAVVEFIRTLLGSRLHRDIGVLICVSRLEEIATLINKMQLAKHHVAVYTTDGDTNALGSHDVDKARVLFITQQMVDSRLSDGKAFKDLSLLHFRGKPRRVKIWDEAMLPAEELTLNVDALARLPSLVRKLSSPLADRLHSLCENVRSLDNATTHKFPDLVVQYGLQYEDAKPLFSKQPTRDRETAYTLWQLSGKSVRITHDLKGNILLDYRNHLPADFFPVIILDASGRVRTTYEFWEKHRRTLVKLATADKRYDNLTIHVWNKGGGKSAFRSNSSDLIEGIAATINTKPDEEWLVVLHKEDEWRIPGHARIPDLTKLIGDLVTNPENVSYLTWGNEKATNEFSAIRNVILAGTLFYPKHVYEVRARASQGMGSEEDLDFDSYKALEMGEHANMILQAACRGSVRKCIGDQGDFMNLFLIASKKTGIPYTLREIFPGAKVKEWIPKDNPLKGKVRLAVEFIRQHYKTASHWTTPLPFCQVQQAIGMKHRQNFNQDIRKHADFSAALIKMQISEVSLNNSQRLTHFRFL